MKKYPVIFIAIILSSFQSQSYLKGTWEFVGGIYNGKKEGAPKEYAMHRKYSMGRYEAFVLEKGSKTQKYEAGNYVFKGDTCVDTETFCSQPSKIMNVTHTLFIYIEDDTLTLKGTLPTGMRVVEYWKSVKSEKSVKPKVRKIQKVSRVRGYNLVPPLYIPVPMLLLKTIILLY